MLLLLYANNTPMFRVENCVRNLARLWLFGLFDQ